MNYFLGVYKGSNLNCFAQTSNVWVWQIWWEWMVEKGSRAKMYKVEQIIGKDWGTEVYYARLWCTICRMDGHFDTKGNESQTSTFRGRKWGNSIIYGYCGSEKLQVWESKIATIFVWKLSSKVEEIDGMDEVYGEINEIQEWEESNIDCILWMWAREKPMWNAGLVMLLDIYIV